MSARVAGPRSWEESARGEVLWFFHRDYWQMFLSWGRVSLWKCLKWLWLWVIYLMKGAKNSKQITYANKMMYFCMKKNTPQVGMPCNTFCGSAYNSLGGSELLWEEIPWGGIPWLALKSTVETQILHLGGCGGPVRRVWWSCKEGMVVL